MFLNWEKIRQKDGITGQYTNNVMKDKDDINFIEVLENTRNNDTKIILIIDESHKSSNTIRARELRDEIKPFLTIEMSATPVLTPDMQMKVTVDPNKVIEEGMIKKEIIINKDISSISNNDIFSQNLILESAYQKRLYLKKMYEKQKANINPLVLIQLPNSDAGEIKKKAVLDFLESKNINIDSGKIGIWLTEDKMNIESEELTKNDSKVEFLLFKQAVDTGWDCPRAQILVKFRESNSIIFEIQTVGRILRMPEAKHYDCDDLNIAYVYTNIKSIEIKKEVYNPNIIKSICSKRTENYGNIKLRSYYKNRIDFGDITSEYTMFFERAFCRFFKIDYKDNEIPNYKESLKKLIQNGIKTIFYPCIPYSRKEYEDANNNSISIILQYGDRRFLFTGDAEEEEEQDIVNAGISIDCDVYKAGHHGSRTSSSEELLNAASPAFVVISCGEGNSYGHPHARTLNEFRQRGIQVFRTDEQGTIEAVTDGVTIKWNCSPSETWKTGN